MAYGPIQQEAYPSAEVLPATSLAIVPTTEELNVGGYKSVNVNVKLVHNAATEVNMVAEIAPQDAPTTWFDVESVVSNGTVLESTQKMWKRAVTGDDNWSWDIPVNCESIRFTFDSVGAGTDTIEVSVICLSEAR